jgi:hypothetical protein
MISLLFFFLAGVFDAFMDTIDEGHFGNSIFRNMNPKFWYKAESWKWAKKIGGYPLDAWHLAKSLMWICVSLGAVVYHYFGSIFPFWPLDFGAIGLVIMLTFNIFYNHIFKKP